MIVKFIRSFILLLALNQCHIVNSLNILGVFPYQGKSHFYVFGPYLRELAEKGHNVTVISYFPLNKPIKNYHDISLAGKSIVFENILPVQQSSTLLAILGTLGMAYMGIENCEKMLEDEDVQDLWKSKRKFDVVVAEQYNGDCSLGLAHKLNAPVVGLTSHVLLPYHYDRFGISYNPSYMSGLFFEGSNEPTLYQRIERKLYYHYSKFIHKYLTQRLEHQILSEYFEDLPPLEELARDIKFLLLYNNFINSGTNIFPSNIIEVGGYHVAKAKPLQGDLLKFIEQSEHGVIYISLGSMINGASFPKDKLQTTLAALAELPQRVVWKWEAKSLPGKPKNIFVSKWLPQNDLLAHPKVLAFYSHCGMLGITEAAYHGVPILGMPMFGDQPINAAALEKSGFGVKIEIKDLTKENLLQKFKIVMDPTFRANVKMLSQAWHDRPVSAMENAVHWTEFAAKYHNFTFRAPAADVPLYEYLCLDIFFILFIIPISVIYIMARFSKRKLNDKTRKSSRKLGSKRLAENKPPLTVFLTTQVQNFIALHYVPKYSV